MNEQQQNEQHFDKFEKLVQTLGVPLLRRVVDGIASPEKLAAALVEDRHLNSIGLRHWDDRHATIRQLVRGPWSLSDTVCVLKHVARHHVLGVPRGK